MPRLFELRSPQRPYDSRAGDPEYPAYRRVCLTLSSQVTNLGILLRRQSRRSLSRPALSRPVERVVPFGSNEQVIGIAAGWIVALMQGTQAFGDGSIHHLPRSAVCKKIPAISRETPVPFGISRALPLPALIRMSGLNEVSKRLLDIFPARHGGTPWGAVGSDRSGSVARSKLTATLFAGKVMGHRSVPFGVAPGVFQHCPALSSSRHGV